MSGANLNSVFYAESYHPIQAGSIDGTDVLPHDNGVYRAHLCSSVGLYDPFGDPKVIGDPYRTVFVGRLSHLTNEGTLRKVMSKYGRVKNLRLVRHIVTGASRGYAFVEYEKEREMLRAYKDAHHSIIDESEVIVDYNRQQLMPGWIPRRLGGGLGGKKESGQLRFGGRERPFRAPLRPIPYDDLKRLGIPPPPEGRYMSRYQVPSPPRRKGNSVDREESSHRRMSVESEGYNGSSLGREGHRHKRSAADQEEPSYRASLEKEEHYIDRRSPEDRCDSFYLEDPIDRDRRHHKRKSFNSEDLSLKGSHKERDDGHSYKQYKSHRYEKYAGSNSSRHTEYSE